MITDTVKAVQDTIQAVASHDTEDTSWILHHILDSHKLFGVIPLPEIHLFGIDLSITQHIVMMWLAFAVLVIAFKVAVSSYKKSKSPKGISNFLEVLVLFVKDEIAKPTIGKGYEMVVGVLVSILTGPVVMQPCKDGRAAGTARSGGAECMGVPCA